MQNKKPIHIALLETSRIICEGIQAILFHSPDMDARVHRVDTLEDLIELLSEQPIDILIASPLHFVNREKEIKAIRKEHPTLALAVIDYGMMRQAPLPHDATFSLYDTPEHIVTTLLKLGDKYRLFCETHQQDDNLTKREIEVLIGVVNGLLNKEIAEELNISVHTVVRHRKNITTKTGIRSQSGLTIYAISKKIVNIEEIEI